VASPRVDAATLAALEFLGFAEAAAEDYGPAAVWDRAARAAGHLFPA
jgi:hypothetical protein